MNDHTGDEIEVKADREAEWQHAEEEEPRRDADEILGDFGRARLPIVRGGRSRGPPLVSNPGLKTTIS
jgi:hypothetical protein